MPEFAKKPTKFHHQGINWNHPIDSIPEGQVCYARNVRVLQQDSITQRPGLTNFTTLGGGTSFIQSISVLNNFNTDLVAFSKVYVLGANITPTTGSLFVGDTSAHLTNGAINPIKLPPTGSSTTSLSGNPLTFVDMAPVGTNTGWKYVGDANMNLSVGYYPGDSVTPGSGTNNGMARGITMGITPPIYTGIPAPVGVGLLNGNYQWMFAYRNLFTGARSNPSAPTRSDRAGAAFPAIICGLTTAQFTVPDTPVDPLTGGSDANIVVDIYRFGGTINDWRYIGTSPGNTLFTDNLPDESILNSPTPPEVTDPITGVTRFNLFRPFVIQDNAVYSTTNGNITVTNGKWKLQAAGTDRFKLDWLPGSAISINNKIFTIYQVISTTLLEITEDGTGTLTVGVGTAPWATQTGTLLAGSPMPHIWGPYGIGTSGAFIFGCGGLHADSGTLYWTNGNDPDSTDLTNSLVVTSPSEPLRGGCVYDGTPYCFTTERMFRIYPGTVPGQFTVQEIPGGKGLWAEFSLTVQSTDIADQSISWVGKDGIYDWSSTAGLVSLTDRDLYPFFPHDDQVGVGPENLFINPLSTAPEPHSVGAPSFASADMIYHRLCWFQGELFYDFPSAGGNYNTLVFDTKQVHGWLGVDQYSNGVSAATVKPVCRGIEIAANVMKLGIGAALMDIATGVTDAGTAVPCRVVTRQDDLGEPRVQKLWGDYMFDASAGNASGGIHITPLADYATRPLLVQAFLNGTRTQNVYSTVTGGLGTLSISFGFDLTWTNNTSPVTLYQFDVAYVPKPELTGLRATDKTDDGYLGAKYLRGLCIEANTFTNGRSVDVLVDDAVVATLTVTTSSQQEIPFAITPIVGSEFQLKPTDTSSLWELFSIRWVWEKWPDLTLIQSNWMDLGTTKAKYVRGFTIPISGPASPSLSFTVTFDGTNFYGTNTRAPSSISAKSPAQYSFNPPILAHQLKLTPSTPCRVWYDEIRWDAEEWPELATFYGPVENLGTSGAKYLRGFELPIETDANSVIMRLHYDNQPTDTTGITLVTAFPAVTTQSLSKNVFPFTPVTPIVAHEFQLNSEGPARFWYGEVKWDFEPWPEFSDGSSAWIDMGTPGAKFLQGMVIPMDTGGNNTTFTLKYDHGATAPVGPFNTPANLKSAEPFSFPTPLIVHEVQLQRNTNCRVWEDEIKWIWEPIPELVTTYTTQPTDHDLPGYHYFFDCYIAYIGSADGPLFIITDEYGSISYQLPVANGTYTRAYLLLHPQKAKWHSYSITSTGGVRLFLKDCEVRMKNWTDKGQYPSSFQSYKPFGDESRVFGARI